MGQGDSAAAHRFFITEKLTPPLIHVWQRFDAELRHLVAETLMTTMMRIVLLLSLLTITHSFSSVTIRRSSVERPSPISLYSTQETSTSTSTTKDQPVAIFADEELIINGVQGKINAIEDDSSAASEYKKGFATFAFITLLNASLAPVWHTVFASNGPPPLFLNAVVSVTALIGLLAFGPFLDGKVATTSALAQKAEQAWSAKSFRGGIELGIWKGLGT